MSRQWKREIKLTTTAGGGLDLSNMRITFRVEEEQIQAPNVATVQVYNLSSETVKKLTQDNGKATITLEAGYEGNVGEIYHGDVVRIWVGKENPTDSYVRFQCASGDRAHNQARVSKTLAAGSQPKDVVDEAVKAMSGFGVQADIMPTKLLTSFKYPRPFVMFGMAKDYLRYIDSSLHTVSSVNRKKVQIVDAAKGPEQQGDTIELNSRTGLIGRPVQVVGVGIEARALINPEFQVNRYVHIDQASIDRADFNLQYGQSHLNDSPYMPDIDADGIYCIRRIVWTGDSRGQAWYADLSLYSQTGGIQTPGAIQQGGPGSNLTSRGPA